MSSLNHYNYNACIPRSIKKNEKRKKKQAAATTAE